MSIPRGTWRCGLPDLDKRGFCLKCGTEAGDHPLDLCLGCGHRVVFHGVNTSGCSRIVAGAFCSCRRAFGQAQTPLVAN